MTKTPAQLDATRPPSSLRTPRCRWLDVDACYRMAEAGVLGRDDRVELIDGAIIDLAPIGSPHAGSVNPLAQALAEPLGRGKVILSEQNPLRLDTHNEPRPDLMLLRPRDDGYRKA